MTEQQRSAALVKDAVDLVRKAGDNDRENFILGAQSMGYFLEDRGSAHELARQLVELVKEDYVGMVARNRWR